MVAETEVDETTVDEKLVTYAEADIEVDVHDKKSEMPAEEQVK